MKITSIGEILYDVYPDGKRLGGAPFNFIYHIWKILGKGNFISSVGNDDNGKEIVNYLKSINFNTDYISIDKQHPTGTVKVKLLKDKTPKFTISPECSYDYIELDQRIIDLVEKETDLLYFGTLSQRSETTRNSIRSLSYKKTKYFSDLNLRHDFFSKEMIEEALNVCNVIKINHHELEKIKSHFQLTGDIHSSMEIIVDKFQLDLLCVTLGSDGAVLYNGKTFDTQKYIPEKVIDTVGAGDAYAAILSIGYLKNWDLKKINRLANQFAADICGVKGAVPINNNIYDKYIREFNDDS